MSVVTFKCPNCDAELTFDPETQRFVCNYCQGSFTQTELEAGQPASASDDTAQGAEAPTVSADTGAAVYSCPSCGAEITVDATTAATYCFYCHNPVVLAGRLEGKFMPHKLIPFKISRDEAVERFMAWTRKKWFVPKYFFSKKQVEKLAGVYFPYWLVDCDVAGSLTAKAERVRRWRSGNTEYIETSHYMLTREGNIHFEDVIKSALKKSNKGLVESVQPFQSSDLIGFSMPYLSGFQAEKRDIEREELQQEVVNDVNTYSRQLLLDTIAGYTSVTPLNVNMQFFSENWDYTLLPVWVLTYQGGNAKTYYYAMNGQTGTVFGRLPVSFGKLSALCGGIFVILAVILLIAGWLF